MARCSYCGLKNDPRTALGFASEWNLCHHASPVASPNLAHQEAYCLSDKHKSCPVFLLAEKKPLPKNVAFVGRRKPPRENAIFFRIGILFLFIASALIGMIAIVIYSYPGNKVPKGSAAVNANFSTLAVSSSPMPTASTTPTLAPTRPMPVCTPPAGWTAYQVAPADTLERLHVIYGVSVADLESANCLEKGYILHSGDRIFMPPLATDTLDPKKQSPTATYTQPATLTSSPRPIIYESPTATKEENRPRRPTPVPPTKTPAPTSTSAPVIPTVPPVPPTPTSPPPPTAPPPTEVPPATPAATP